MAIHDGARTLIALVVAVSGFVYIADMVERDWQAVKLEIKTKGDSVYKSNRRI